MEKELAHELKMIQNFQAKHMQLLESLIQVQRETLTFLKSNMEGKNGIAGKS